MVFGDVKLTESFVVVECGIMLEVDVEVKVGVGKRGPRRIYN